MWVVTSHESIFGQMKTFWFFTLDADFFSDGSTGELPGEIRIYQFLYNNKNVNLNSKTPCSTVMFPLILLLHYHSIIPLTVITKHLVYFMRHFVKSYIHYTDDTWFPMSYLPCLIYFKIFIQHGHRHTWWCLKNYVFV